MEGWGTAILSGTGFGMTNDAKRADLLAYRWKRAFRWYRVRLWGTGPLILVVAAIAAFSIDNATILAIARIALFIGLNITLMAAWSVWTYFRWLP
jgi:hypothetical protein